MTKTKQSTKQASIASTADKFKCYQLSVQTPEHEVEFFDRAFKDVYGRKPTTLREDFCGTFAVCCEWIKLGRQRKAVGVDLCDETLQWGRDNNLAKLTKNAATSHYFASARRSPTEPTNRRRPCSAELLFLDIQDS